MRTTKNYTFRLEERVDPALVNKLAKKLSISKSEVVRRAIRAYAVRPSKAHN